jgi:carboxypeptidase PM20D1
LGQLISVLCLTICLSAVSAEADAPIDAEDMRIAERLARAIRIESVSHQDPADFRGGPFLELAALLRETYPRTHASLALETVNDYTLLFRWPGRNGDLAPALFMSHLDVVPVEASARENWTHPPFAGVIADGMVWGRGALDVKIGVILWLEAVERLLEEDFQPERTLYFSFGHDEEIGGDAGAKAVAERLGERGIRLAFLFDEGGFIFDDSPLLPGKVTAQIMTAEKVYFTVTLSARGLSGHSSIPPAHSAIGRLASAIHRLEANPMSGRLSDPVRQMFEAAAPHLPFSERLAFGNLWLTESMILRRMLADPMQGAMVRTTAAVTLIEGGVKENVMPEFAQATVNFRILPGDTPEDVLAHVRAVIDDSEIEVEAEPWGGIAAPGSIHAEGFTLAAEAALAVLPDAVVLPGLIPGATDARHFTDIAEDSYRFAPARISMELMSGFHGRDERIPIAHLGESAKIATEMVRRAGQP